MLSVLLLRPQRLHIVILLCILIMSGYVHLWNPVGFPDIFFDEGIYMRRALNMIETGNPQEAWFYDHPYFGQVVLAGLFKLFGFPESVQESPHAAYMLPRLFMGILSVLDTFLVYKIAEKKFGRRTAIIASVLFAAMPITWFLRRILLDSILLPLMLSSLLLAMHSGDSKRVPPSLLLICSATLMGLAIFTKVTAVTLAPVVGYVIYTNCRRWVDLGKWMVPVLLIPAAWPVISVYLGHFKYWMQDVLWQAGRGTQEGFAAITATCFLIDPVFMSLAYVAFVYAALRRQVFLLLWFVPFLAFVNVVGFVQYFHYILILPAAAVAAAYMINDSIQRRVTTAKRQDYAFVATVATLAVFGVVVSTIIVSEDVSARQFEVIERTLEVLDNDDDYNDDDGGITDGVTLLAGPSYSWVFDDLYQRSNVLPDYSSALFGPLPTQDYVLIADPHFMIDVDRGEILYRLYNESQPVAVLRGPVENIDYYTFPFGSMFVMEATPIELRVGTHLTDEQMGR